MSAKRKKYDTRTILMVLLVIAIVATVVIVVINLPPEENTLTPEEVIRNPNKYLDGETIIVKGYYNPTGNIPYVASALSDETVKLKIDYSNIENASNITLIKGLNHVYKFTGTLSIDDENPLIEQYVLIVDKIVEV